MMFNFIVGIVLGIVLATIGAQGVVDILDKSVHAIETVARETKKQI